MLTITWADAKAKASKTTKNRKNILNQIGRGIYARIMMFFASFSYILPSSLSYFTYQLTNYLASTQTSRDTPARYLTAAADLAYLLAFFALLTYLYRTTAVVVDNTHSSQPAAAAAKARIMSIFEFLMPIIANST